MKPTTNHKDLTLRTEVSPNECAQHILPIRDALDILNGKWKLPIMGTLAFGKKRFKTLQRDLKGITAKMLSKELKDLEVNQLVKRTVHDTTPPTVEYEMTPYGASLDNVISELHAWGAAHRKRILSGKVTDSSPPQKALHRKTFLELKNKDRRQERQRLRS